MNRIHIKHAIRMVIVICQLSIVNCFTACTKVDIHYPIVEPVHGLVQIYPDMSKHTLPALQYHFYNTDTDQEYIVRACDGSGNFEGMIPVGTYRVIATNTDAKNVEFRNMDSHETAIVEALRIENGETRFGLSQLKIENYRADGINSAANNAVAKNTAQPTVNCQLSTVNYLAQPDKVYSTVVEELTVTRNNPARHEPAPALLTRQLNLVFTLKDGLETEVADMSGILPGVYPAVHLFTCQGIHIDQSPGMAVVFQTVPQDDKRVAHINLFGVLDPEYGDIYTHILELELTMTDGSTSVTTLDLTEALSEILEKNEGTLPLELSISIEMTKTSIGVGGEVGGWIEEGEDHKEESV